MSDNVIERIKNYCKTHSDLANSGIIKGIDSGNGEIVLEKDGVSKRVSIDVLENNMFDFDKFEIKKDEISINNLDEMVKEEQPEELIESLDENEVSEKIPSTLAEMQQCIASKNEKLIDKALETFAIDDRTGIVNINKAIKVVTDNSVENVISCVRDNKVLPTSLSSYDIKGKCISEKEDSEELETDDLIDSSFNNILVYVELAKLKNVVYNEEQIFNAKTKYKAQVNDKLNVLGLSKQKEENKIMNFEAKKQEKGMSYELKPDKDIKKAGFADIIILTIIVLIYAAIIINLITKLK